MMAGRAKVHIAKSKRVKAANESIQTFPKGPLLKTADAAEAIADNLRMLARPQREPWLEQSVRDWYEVVGRELRKLGILK
jgi:hypothetical protein